MVESMTGKPTDRLALQGRVSIYQEDESGDREYICDRSRNHFVNGMLRGLTSFLCGSYLGNSASSNAYRYYGMYGWKIQCGIDESTPTTCGMAELASVNPTLPTTQVCEGVVTTPSSRSIKWDATWNAGTINGRIGEFGLYFRPYNSIVPLWSSMNYTFPVALCSRLSSASGDFDAFTIDPTRSLTITWEVGMSYV